MADEFKEWAEARISLKAGEAAAVTLMQRKDSAISRAGSPQALFVSGHAIEDKQDGGLFPGHEAITSSFTVVWSARSTK